MIDVYKFNCCFFMNASALYAFLKNSFIQRLQSTARSSIHVYNL